MNVQEKKLLSEETGGELPVLCIRSGARVDAGRWWRRTPLWLCVVADQLAMLAVGRRRYFAKLPLADCGASHYNHATGELVIEPSEGLRFSRIPLTPREALQILPHLKSDSPTD